MEKRGVVISVLVGLLILVVLNFLVPKLTGNAVSSVNCIETDNGKDYYVKGSIEYGTSRKGEDYCVLENQLKEYYCEDNKMMVGVYQCEECNDGACVKSNPEMPTPVLEESGENNWGWVIGTGLVIIIGFIYLRKKK